MSPSAPIYFAIIRGFGIGFRISYERYLSIDSALGPFVFCIDFRRKDEGAGWVDFVDHRV